MKTTSRNPNSIRRYVIRLQLAARYYVQNKFIDVSIGCVVFIFRVQAELIGE